MMMIPNGMLNLVLLQMFLSSLCFEPSVRDRISVVSFSFFSFIPQHVMIYWEQMEEGKEEDASEH